MATDLERQQINWRSRIVRSGTIKASQITPHPQNPRRHPQLQREAVAASFNELGQIARIVINVNNGYLVDGEERSWLALAQEQDVDVECDWVDLTEEEHLKALTYFDATTNLAYYDASTLDELLQEVNSDSPAIQQMLASLAAGAGLYHEGQDPNELWQGMPEFNSENLGAYRTIQVHIASAEDMSAFAKLIGQPITDKTKYINFPFVADENLKPYQVVDES